ncbi:MAG: endonuclease/exonuclease/phosphatase family protein [Bacillota bacterium]
MLLRVLTYNIRHGEGLDGRVALGRIAAVLAACDADLVALQEVDVFRPRSGFRHQARALAWVLGTQYVFGPTLVGAWAPFFGNAVLSKLPVLGAHRYRLPGKGEPRGLLRVTVDAGAGPVDFLATHLGLSTEARRAQVKRIAGVLGEINKPFVLAGDFNCRPGAAELAPLLPLATDVAAAAGATEPTFPAGEPEARIDYILVSRHWEVHEAKTIGSEASDHLPVLAVLHKRQDPVGGGGEGVLPV